MAAVTSCEHTLKGFIEILFTFLAFLLTSPHEFFKNSQTNNKEEATTTTNKKKQNKNMKLYLTIQHFFCQRQTPVVSCILARTKLLLARQRSVKSVEVSLLNHTSMTGRNPYLQFPSKEYKRQINHLYDK